LVRVQAAPLGETPGRAGDSTEIREVRRDTFTTEDVDDYRRDLLESGCSPRTAQKKLVLLHGVFKLAKRRKRIEANPSEDAERVTLDDPGVFNVLEPVEFEAVYRAVLGELDERDEKAREKPDAIDQLDADERELYGAALSTAFYAGPRMGENRDLPWRNVEFGLAVLRWESGFTHGERSMRVHDLRHGFCTWAVNSWEITKVKEYAGHRDIKTTMRYVHHKTKAADADAGGSYLDGVLGDAPNGLPLVSAA
jgi:integrase